MKEKLQPYKKYFEYGIFIIIMISIVLGIWKLFEQGPTIVRTTSHGIRTFLDVISPIIYASAFAYILYRPVCWIERKINKGALASRLISIAIVFMIVGGALIGLLYAIIPPVVENIQELIGSNPQLQHMVAKFLEQLPISLDAFREDFIAIVQSKDVLRIAIAYIEEVLGGVGSVVIDTVAAIILTFYFLKDRERLIVAIDRFGTVIFPKKIKEYVKTVLRDIDDILGGFIIGTILAGIVVGLVSTSLMLMIKHPFAVLIGTVAGVMNMVPYVGPLVGAVLALILGLLDSVQLGVTGCILLLLYQQIDGNFIEPKIVGDKIGLPAVWILIVVIIGGSYYGGIGMILSAPVAAFIKVYIDRVYNYKVAKGKV